MIFRKKFIFLIFFHLRKGLFSPLRGERMAFCLQSEHHVIWRAFFTFFGLELNDLLKNKLSCYPKDERRAFYENPLEQPTI